MRAITVFSIFTQVLCTVLGQEANLGSPDRYFNRTSEIYSPSEWMNILKDLELKADPNTETIPQSEDAGKISQSISHQIIGGSQATLGQFPWQAYVDINSAYLCGGSLILPNTILTAAHCAQPGISFVVTLGSIDRSTYTSGSVRVQTRTKFVHESYNSYNLNNDIALLILPSNVPLSTTINLVKLPPASDATNTFQGVTARVSGFGKTSTSTGATASRYLNFVDLNVVSNAECLAFYGSSVVKSSTLCTKLPDKSTCQGDSGGPLVVQDSSFNFKQIGIVSFGSSQGCLVGYSGFSRVASYLQWISSKVGPASSAVTEPTTTEPTTTSPTTTSPTTTSPTTAVPTTAGPTTTGPTAAGPTSTESTTTSPTTTSTTQRPITTAQIGPSAPLQNCASFDFTSTRSYCCATLPLTNTVDLVAGEKTCGVSSSALNAFNQYKLNRVLDMRLNNTINLASPDVQRSIATDACFVNCYLSAKRVVKYGALFSSALKNFLVANQYNYLWTLVTETATTACINKFYTSIPPTILYDGNQFCDVRPYLVVQCVQHQLTRDCPIKTSSNRCESEYQMLTECPPKL